MRNWTEHPRVPMSTKAHGRYDSSWVFQICWLCQNVASLYCLMSSPFWGLFVGVCQHLQLCAAAARVTPCCALQELGLKVQLSAHVAARLKIMRVQLDDQRSESVWPVVFAATRTHAGPWLEASFRRVPDASTHVLLVQQVQLRLAPSELVVEDSFLTSVLDFGDQVCVCVCVCVAARVDVDMCACVRAPALCGVCGVCVVCTGKGCVVLVCTTGGTSPQFWCATTPSPPLPALRAHLVAKGQ